MTEAAGRGSSTCSFDGGTVVTMDSERRVIDDGAVAIDAGKIVAVGQGDEIQRAYRGKKTISARRRAVMPGLHDLHSHAGVELVKGAAERFPGKAWRNIMDFVAYHTSAEWWYLEAMLIGHPALEVRHHAGALHARQRAARRHARHSARATPRASSKSACARSSPSARRGRPGRANIRIGATAGGSSGWSRWRRPSRSPTTRSGAGTARMWAAGCKMWVAVSRILNENFADQVYEPAERAASSGRRPRASAASWTSMTSGSTRTAWGPRRNIAMTPSLGLLGPEDRVRARLAVQCAHGRDPGRDRHTRRSTVRARGASISSRAACRSPN